MLNQEQIIEYAIKGINADIEKIEKSIRRGQSILREYDEGIKPKTEMPPHEVRKVIQSKKEEIENLIKLENELKWELLEIKGELK